MRLKYLICLLVGIVGIALIGASRQNPAEATPSLQEDELIQRGEYLTTVAGCVHCHTPNQAEYNVPPQDLTQEQLTLLVLFEMDALDRDRLFAGGRYFDFGEAGEIFTPNLTPDEETGIGSWSEEDIKLTLRTSVNPDGRRLHPFMPNFAYMAEDDLDAIVAYLKSLPPIENVVPRLDAPPVPPVPLLEDIPQTAPDGSDPIARGQYLVDVITGCNDCHTPRNPETGAPDPSLYLSGSQPFEGPWGIVYSGNITPHETGIAEWTTEDIERVLTAGVRIDGRRIGFMPWQLYAQLTPEDLDALVAYLTTIEPIESSVPVTAMNEAFIQYDDTVREAYENRQASNVDDDDDDEEDDDMAWLPLAGGLIILFFGAVVLVRKRRSKASV